MAEPEPPKSLLLVYAQFFGSSNLAAAPRCKGQFFAHVQTSLLDPTPAANMNRGPRKVTTGKSSVLEYCVGPGWLVGWLVD